MVMEMFSELPIHRYDFLKTHGVENFEMLYFDPHNVSFMYDDELYEFCGVGDELKSLYRLRADRMPVSVNSGKSLSVPYVFKYCNKEFNKMIGVPENTCRYAHYTVFSIITTDNEEKAKIAKDYVSHIYVELYKRLLRSYERLPVAIYTSYQEKESWFKRFKRWLGLIDDKPPVVQHMYQLDLNRMKLHQIVRNISADFKKKLSTSDLNKLNSSGLILLVNTNTPIQSTNLGHVTIGIRYRKP